jgi:hypothetical protein
LGSWKPEGKDSIVAKTIDFDFPPSPEVVARLDFTLNFGGDPSQVSGTVTITYFPLETGNPLEGGGTVIADYTLEGELVKP